MKLKEIIEMLRDAKSKTNFYERSNETYYPASWTYGAGALDASTSTPYDRCRQLATDHVASKLGIEGDFDCSGCWPQRAARQMRDALKRLDQERAAIEEEAESELE